MRLRRLLSLLLPLGLLSPVLAENYFLVGKPECIETEIGGFTHPGIFVSCEDLMRAQTKVWAGEEPWLTAFGRMSNQSLVGLAVNSVSAYNIRGSLPQLPYGQDAWSSNFTVDAQYAYLNSVAYFISGQIDYIDLFEFDDCRLLAGLEYFAKFNLWHEVPFALHKSPDRGIIYRNLQHPTDLGTLNPPTSAYYRYKELAPGKIKYLKTFVESQTLGLDSLLYMKEGNHEDLNFIWDAGYGASYMDIISGPGASRRFSKANETYESRLNNNTFPDIAVLDANTTISYPSFFGTTSKPSILIEAMAERGSDLVVTNQLGQLVLEVSWPASDLFSAVHFNTTLGEDEDNQFLFLFVSDDVDIARFKVTEMADATVPYDDPTIEEIAA